MDAFLIDGRLESTAKRWLSVDSGSTTLRNTIQLAIRTGWKSTPFTQIGISRLFAAPQEGRMKPYVNWNEVEERKAWETGHGEPDREAIKSRLTCLRI